MTKKMLGVLARPGLAMALAGLTTLAACGSPTKPGSVEPDRVTSLALTPGTDLLKVGASMNLSLEASFSNGTKQTMSVVTWGSDNPAVAQVSGGRVVAVGPGEATVYGDCQHGRAQRRIRVVPDYQGSWAGMYRVGSCTADGDWQSERICDELNVPADAPIMLRLAHERTDVSGTIVLGTLAGDANGTIGIPGRLSLNGAVTYEEDGLTVRITLSDWSTLATGTRMTGGFTQVWSIAGISGSMRLGCEMLSVDRTSQALQIPAVRPAAPGSERLPQRVRRWLGLPR
jgi:hypothetical protein